MNQAFRAEKTQIRIQAMKEPVDLRKRTKDFALRIVRLYRALPESGESRVLKNQLLRSGTSVGANFREGIRARPQRNL